MAHQYRLISADNPETLSAAVTAALAEDWELWGNPFAIQFTLLEKLGYIDYCQAVVRFEPESQNNTADQAHVLTDRPAAGYTVSTPENYFHPFLTNKTVVENED